MKILGIDPGSMVTGYGIIEKESNNLSLLEYGSIKTNSKSPLGNRLARIYDGLSDIIRNKAIEEVGIEEAFYAKNVKTTLTLGHARGVILLSAEKAGTKISEYSPREVKKAVTGNGAASKEQVQYMVKQILSIKDKIEPEDAADALAVAICHGNRIGLKYQ